MTRPLPRTPPMLLAALLALGSAGTPGCRERGGTPAGVAPPSRSAPAAAAAAAGEPAVEAPTMAPPPPPPLPAGEVAPVVRALHMEGQMGAEPDSPATREVPDVVARNRPLMERLSAAGIRDQLCQGYTGRAMALFRFHACAFLLPSDEAARAVADALPAGRRVVVGPDARLDGNELRFAQGPLFVVVRSAGTPQEARPTFLIFAGESSRQLREAGIGDLAVRFPARDRLDDEPAYVAIDAFGFEGIDTIWKVRYRVGDREVEAFQGLHETPGLAAATLARWTVAFDAWGGRVVEDGPGCRLVQAYDAWFGAFAAGTVFGGVHMVDDPDAARTVCRRLRDFALTGGEP